MEIIKGTLISYRSYHFGKTGHRGGLPHRPRKDQSKEL